MLGLPIFLAFSVSVPQAQQPPLGALTRPSKVDYRGPQFVNQRWDLAADKPFLELRAEHDRLWRTYRKGDPKRELVDLCDKALAAHRAHPDAKSLYKALSMSFLATWLSDHKGRGALLSEWPVFKGNKSLEAARIVYLYHFHPFIDEDTSTEKIAFNVIRRNASDEPVELKICNDAQGQSKPARNMAFQLAAKRLEQAYDDPQWASAAACAYVAVRGKMEDFEPPSPVEENHRIKAISFQLMYRFETMINGGIVAMGSKQLEKNWAKSFPKRRLLSSYPWQFGPNRGKPFKRD